MLMQNTADVQCARFQTNSQTAYAIPVVQLALPSCTNNSVVCAEKAALACAKQPPAMQIVMSRASAHAF